MELDSLTILLHRPESESAVVWERETFFSESQGNEYYCELFQNKRDWPLELLGWRWAANALWSLRLFLKHQVRCLSDRNFFG